MAATRRRRRVRRLSVAALALGLLGAAGFVVWAEHPMRAEAAPLAAVRADHAVAYRDEGDVVLAPRRPSGTGLVLLAGARVDAPAYAAKLAGVADAGTTVVIVRPLLNFALLDPRPLSAFEAAAPHVRHWYVGGHSLGGVRACRYAADDARVEGLVLLGSYCADDLSSRRLRVLSIGGSRDGLSTPAKIAAARHLLPASARLVQLPGASHASFGDYGVQPGDGTPTASDAEVERTITAELTAFLAPR